LIAHDDGALDQVRREVEERGGSALLGAGYAGYGDRGVGARAIGTGLSCDRRDRETDFLWCYGYRTGRINTARKIPDPAKNTLLFETRSLLSLPRELLDKWLQPAVFNREWPIPPRNRKFSQ